MATIVILGAGISGLTVAYQLYRQGHTVRVVERCPVPGGVMTSTEEAGVLVEHGPNTVPGNSRALLSLCQSLGLRPQPSHPCARNRYVYFRGQLWPVPTQPLAFLQSGLLSPLGKLRLLGEPFQPRRKPNTWEDDESVRQFMERRLGRQAMAQLVGPFLSGVYAGDPDEMSAAAVFPRLVAWERQHGSLMAGGLSTLWRGRKKAARTPAATPSTDTEKALRHNLLTFDGGLGRLPRVLAHSLPPECRIFGEEASTLRPLQDGRYEVALASGATLTGDAVVLALPADGTARLLQGWEDGAAAALEAIPYAEVGVIHVGVPRAQIPHPLDGFGCLVPRSEGLTTLGLIWTSALFPQRAPTNMALLTAFVGGATQPGLLATHSDDMLTIRLLGEMETLLGAKALVPQFLKVVRWPRAIPQYTRHGAGGHAGRIAQLNAALHRHPGLFACGNYLTGVSVNHCITLAGETAQQVGQWLQTRRRGPAADELPLEPLSRLAT
jgi:oxygen-dependent protoporphyrinogen oxidase